MADKKKKATAPAARDLGAELGAATSAAEAYARAQSAAAIETNQAFIDQALAATGTIAGNLNNGYTTKALGQLDAAGAQIPQLGMLADRMGALAGVAEGDVGGTEIERLLEAQALEELGLGRSLSVEQEREATQAARQGMAVRGMAVGTPSALAEILARDTYAGARQESRRAFAGNVNQLTTNNRLQRLGTAGNLLGQTAGTRGNLVQLGTGLGQAYIAVDPYQRALGSNIPIASQGPSASMTSNAFGQVLGYSSDVANSNYNAQWSEYLRKQNEAAAKKYGGLGYSSAGGGGMGTTLGAGIGTGVGAGIGALFGGVGAPVGAALGGAVGGGLGSLA